MLYAHSLSGVSGVWHTLEDHLRGSAALARRFGEVFGAGELAEYERYTQLACAAVVFGHHGGLPDMERLRDELHKGRPGGSEAARVQEAIRAVERIVPEIHRSSRIAPPGWLFGLPKRDQRLGLDLLVRMLFSCVVDADYLDTSAHFEGAAVRVGEPVDMAALVERYEARRKRYLAGRESSPVDALRQSVYERACVAAAGEPGVYVLQVPTGGGEDHGRGRLRAAACGAARQAACRPGGAVHLDHGAERGRVPRPARSRGRKRRAGGGGGVVGVVADHLVAILGRPAGRPSDVLRLPG
ncbi:CRISPR-associated endonuclease Cas3'' [Streptomyces sp. NPDC058451]|uniref:CRISPR-associated endonuclease Cas3'' n=1 Tax=Streptomyces sp. NPDC058451 TaxID=3346506 RepID=UPI0036609D14